MSKLAANNGQDYRSRQDAQQAKQGQMQVEHNKAVAEGKTPAKDNIVHIVPPMPASGAQDRAPHTKRAIQQHKIEDKVTAAQTRLDAAKTNLDAAIKATQRAPKNPQDPKRLALFGEKAKAELELLAARKVLGALKRETESPEDKAAREKKSSSTTPRTPRVTVNQKIKPGTSTYPEGKSTWTGYMIKITCANKDTDSATDAHKKGAGAAGYPATKPLDFKWMVAKGYIVLS
jgi:hypothetical protein